MIKLKDKYNMTQHPWMFILFLLYSITIHSFFLQYSTVLGPEGLPVPSCLGTEWVQGAPGAVMK